MRRTATLGILSLHFQDARYSPGGVFTRIHKLCTRMRLSSQCGGATGKPRRWPKNHSDMAVRIILLSK